VIKGRITAPRFGGRAGPRRSTAVAEAARPVRRFVFFFDLDDTLHDASHAIFRQIDTRMTDYVERHLEVDRGEANRLRTFYWHRYGATMLGLVRHHAVDPTHFLRETHDFDVAALVRAERGLTRLFARLPGRKVLLTNAPKAYANEVLRALAVHRHFRAGLAGCPGRGQRRQPAGRPRDGVPHGPDDRTRKADSRGVRQREPPPGGSRRARDPIAAPVASRSRPPAALRAAGCPR
jgi:pyrimidine 5'-nucleotidase